MKANNLRSYVTDMNFLFTRVLQTLSICEPTKIWSSDIREKLLEIDRLNEEARKITIELHAMLIKEKGNTIV